MKVLLVLLLSVGAFASRIPRVDWKIVGGETAEEGQFPYQISLRMYGSHNCGGSIISPTVVLCAAHCVQGSVALNSMVITGTHKIDGKGYPYQVKTFTMHEDFDFIDLTNDISLIYLTSDIQYNPLVQPIALGTSVVGADVDLVLTGWGSTSFPGSSPKILQYIKLKSISNEECVEMHGDSSSPITDGHICTLTHKGEGACYGDSGGPLVSDVGQVGIVSWGRPCAIGYPDVFTRVSFYTGWINDNSINK